MYRAKENERKSDKIGNALSLPTHNTGPNNNKKFPFKHSNHKRYIY